MNKDTKGKGGNRDCDPGFRNVDWKACNVTWETGSGAALRASHRDFDLAHRELMAS